MKFSIFRFDYSLTQFSLECQVWKNFTYGKSRNCCCHSNHLWRTPAGGRKEVGIFLWKHSRAGKRGESSVNQAVAKNDVDQNFVFVGNYSFLHITARIKCELAWIFRRRDIYVFSGGHRTCSWSWEISISAARNIKRKNTSLLICFFFFWK